MRWFILQPGDFARFTRARVLDGPPRTEPGPAYFALSDEHPPPGRRLPETASWIVAPSDTIESSAGIPVAIVETATAATVDFWRTVLRMHPRHPVDIAAYANRHGPGVEIFLEALGLRGDYRSRDEWRQMAALDEDTRSLARHYDFPFAVLRLWNRLDRSDRETWRAIFEARILKKNLVREIIVDFYDLTPDTRTETLAEADAFARDWKARSGSFPGDALRDMVRARRYPRMSANREQVAALKKEIGLPPRARLDLPDDLESTRLKLELEFGSLAQLEEQLAYFNAERRAGLEKILDLL